MNFLSGNCFEATIKDNFKADVCHQSLPEKADVKSLQKSEDWKTQLKTDETFGNGRII